MTPAEFEEKEYEQPLYHQLERGDTRFWSPGQVLEAYLGFDRGLFLTAAYLWNLHGHSSPLPGVVPHMEYWPWRPHFHGRRDRLPNFRLNCFLQSKRCFEGRRLPKRLAELGPTRPFYRFDIDAKQQAVLFGAAAALQYEALFAYAAPVFSKSQRLFFMQQTGRIVEHSTFPDVRDLNGHRSWYYSQPGAIGVVNQEYRRVEGPSLSDRANVLLVSDRLRGESPTASQNLIRLSNAIRASVVEGPEAAASARRAFLVEDWYAIEAFAESNDLPPAARAFLDVEAFVRRFNLSWLVLGQVVA